MPSYVVILMTTPNKEEAMKIVRSLLEKKLIACANIVGPVSSLFWWEGKIDQASEFLVFMKAHKNLFEKLSGTVREIHSYEVPEIVALPIIEGLPPYMEWLKASLQSVSDDG